MKGEEGITRAQYIERPKGWQSPVNHLSEQVHKPPGAIVANESVRRARSAWSNAHARKKEWHGD